MKAKTHDPLTFLRAVMNDATAHAQLRLAAAVALSRFTHGPQTRAGKKVAQRAAAEVAVRAFGADEVPRLRVVGRAPKAGEDE